MSNQHYFSLSWSAYQTTLCSSFSFLQQRGDFVDMTLAAEGHLVKVHQLIMGIASPYIKHLLMSASCQHPVIFLYNMSYTTLSNILQYVYTGEVALSEDQLNGFFEAAKSLQIIGIDSMDIPSEWICEIDTSDNDNIIQLNVSDEKNKNVEEIPIPVNAKNIMSTNAIEDPQCSMSISDEISMRRNESNMSVSDNCEAVEMDSGSTKKYKENQTQLKVNPHDIRRNELQYTVSTRGALQLILNRYIYNLFSKGSSGVVRRWRCIDYRDKKCPACTITNGNVVVKRTSLHNHPYHDKKIMDKLKKKAVYSTLKTKIVNKIET